ncbi:TauD/TfdA family dioxygenase [Patulibacter sp.]|uniref:TauD/TfdA dioxygenase family protein n=1 Tax=Patulibacter sp. TaxID=1912859 RepID=UPI00271BAE3F|nr:TauD/TfdA family dioxygenase [Patulibacter sp.]MDO9408316.1 TauD/TfdA family dioxygenase [Patulibacter sp.]
MDVETLDPVGARVTGTTLRDLGPDGIEELRGLLAEHGVVVLPGQDDATDEDFVAFLRRFGPLAFTKGEASAPGFPDLNVVSNVGRTTPPKSSWHVDTSYVRKPPAYTALRAVQIPEQGGATLFSDQARALTTLDPALREMVEDRSIRHVVTGVVLEDGDEHEAWHPIVRPHPLTGRPGLYLTTPGRCAEVSGLSDEEGEDVVARLFHHSTRPENVHAHAWEAGDVVIWDNARVLHRAEHSDVRGDRVMHRGMVAAHRAA